MPEGPSRTTIVPVGGRPDEVAVDPDGSLTRNAPCWRG